MDILLAVTVAYVIFLIISKLTAPKVEHVSGKMLDEMLGDKTNKKQYIDVRTAGEFNSRKVKGFKNIPLDQLHKRMKEIDADMPVVLMCASGSRSMKAAKILNKNGYKTIVNVKGGISSYPSK
ncbi:rhodanese-like domain-containing protein [Fusibacter bizertensis]|uniref:Rhodanese-like domain-containing protein n=1 Tax=Fusibacter bizertensis TaxID=1488331 RepID=A0ABT6NCZ2_9FIRM|nr:rhodanese-like domain-containing protein [Fusibacter bizertensis]MDH8678283.1 rhodanese-like domain-containing protein [Fusibacter bizertensis]